MDNVPFVHQYKATKRFIKGSVNFNGFEPTASWLDFVPNHDGAGKHKLFICYDKNSSYSQTRRFDLEVTGVSKSDEITVCLAKKSVSMKKKNEIRTVYSIKPKSSTTIIVRDADE